MRRILIGPLRDAGACRPAVALGALVLLLATAAWAGPPAQQPIIVGINRDYPPYEYLDRAGRPAGFDVDLVRAVAEVEGVSVEFRAGVWDELVEQFKRGELDMLAGLLHSKEREQFASFSTPHLIVHYSIFVRREDRGIRSEADLRGRAVLVERGSQMHDLLRAGALGARPVPVPSEPEALTRLAAGEGDAAVVPQLEAVVLARQRGLRVRQVGGPVLTRELCFGVRRDRPELLSRLNTGLAVLYQTGRYATLYKQRFGEPLSDFGVGRFVPWALGGLGALMLALVAVMFWNWSLRRQVSIATHRLQTANAEIREREQFLDMVIENLPLGIFVKDPRRGFALSLWNNRSEEMFDIPRQEALGKTDDELFPAGEAEAFLASDLQLMATRAPVEMIEQPALSRSQGTRLLRTRKVPLLDEQGDVVLILGITEDITDRAAMESAMRESRRLEGLGVLAGGIAHDFNNLLTAILGNLGLAMARIQGEHSALPLLRTVETTALRAADLTRQMLAYAGKATFVVRPVDLNQATTEMAELLKVSIPANVTLRHDLATGLPAVEADPAQIHQVILNLLTNASDAIGEATGQIVLSTTLEDFAEAPPPCLHPASPPIRPGRYVVLRVADSGGGMTPETIARVFDPFFTTKFTGHGLGLSALLGILKAHEAGIAVQSAPAKGSDFALYFPAIDARAPETKGLEALAPTPRGRGTILLVEDVASLRETTARMLVHLGFEVLEAADGEAALATYGRERARIQLVLTDLTMPGMNGMAVARAIRALDPRARVVLMSGFPRSSPDGGPPSEDFSGFLPKPFRLQDLRDAIDKGLA